MSPPRVLQIQEILAIIFQTCPLSTNAICARVCRAWSDPALDALWREVKDLRNLLKLIPAFFGDRFERDLAPADWVRFMRHARRIRSLEHSDRRVTLDPSVFMALGISRPVFDILPNLRYLRWSAHGENALAHAVLFMSPSLASFEVFALSFAPRGIGTFFQTLQERSPHLRFFYLHAIGSVAPVESFLAGFLKSLTYLEVIQLPCYWQTRNVVTALSTLKHLRSVRTHVPSRTIYRGQTREVEDIRTITFTDGCFPALKTFYIDGRRLSEIEHLLRKPHAPKHLTTLTIMSLQIENSAALHDFIKVLAELCPSLRHIVLALYVSETSNPPSIINFDVIRPILDFPRLVGFKITHKEPLQITEDDIKEMAMNWHALETLHLCHDPYILEAENIDSGLSPDCLLSFAEHCPNIKELGLYINATRWNRNEDLPPTPRPFGRLQRLHVGVSRVTHPNVIARFLSDICPRPLVIFTDSCWETAAVRESVPVSQSRREVWQQVATFHRDLLEVRMLERRLHQEKAKAMEVEITKLKRNASMHSEIGDISMDK
ncbi:hypothetical protein Clacol_001739 [Clathrus columnatus]|uniref:F-box domain-containing protein n=1 Tax=Clathrus columnatus TaxID=1419009 RepID=A0AAV5A1Q5_9AGAM|nr:hypothetical protein Clacol_001739 [Clathrus columnatus]